MEHRRPSRTDDPIKLPQSNQPTPPRRHRVGGGHDAPNKGEWDQRFGRLFEGRLAFHCPGYTCGIHTAEIRIRKPAGSLAFWGVVGEFLNSAAICANPAVTVTVVRTNRPGAKPREVDRRGSSAVTGCSEKVKRAAERGDLGPWSGSCSG